MDAKAQRIVERFTMQPHPEGGYFREVYRSDIEVRAAAATRRGSTLIYFLLADEEFSAFHRVRGADEVWHLYAGGPLELHIIGTDGRYERRVLTTAFEDGEPTGVVPADALQAARLAPGAGWMLCGCTVAPGFEFEDFEMPPRASLVSEHPEHAAIIEALTR
jgi:predicted cupin superfamily sugar epimerase